MKAVAAVVVVAREGGLRKDAKRLLLLAPGPGFLAALHISRLFEKVFTGQCQISADCTRRSYLREYRQRREPGAPRRIAALFPNFPGIYHLRNGFGHLCNGLSTN